MRSVWKTALIVLEMVRFQIRVHKLSQYLTYQPAVGENLGSFECLKQCRNNLVIEFIFDGKVQIKFSSYPNMLGQTAK